MTRSDRQASPLTPNHAPPPMRGARWFWPAVVLLQLGSAAIHVPSLRNAHFEGDEVIFTFMAERIRSDPLNYSLRGPLTGAAARRFVDDAWLPIELFDAKRDNVPPEIYADIRRGYRSITQPEVLYKPFLAPEVYAYDPEVYDRPMFFHPPLYPTALAGFRAAFGTVGGPLLSLLMHALLVLVVALLGRRWAEPWVGIVAAALIATDPVSAMSGSRLWIEGLLQCLTAAAVLSTLWALDRGGAWRAALAGLVLGAAFLAKFPAILIAPAIAVAALLAPRRPSRGAIFAYAAGAAALSVPWLILTRMYYGAWLPSAYPTEWLMAHYEYVRMLVNRPWHFYVSGVLLTMPVLVFAVVAALRLRRERWVAIPLTWAIVFVGVLWALGLRGQGYQLRYLAPATPALCILAAAGIVFALRQRVARRWAAVPAVVLALVTGIAAVWSPIEPPASEPVPIVIYWVCKELQVDFFQAFPGMWR